MENMETINKIGTETTNMPNMLYSGSYSILIMIRRAAIWSTMIYAALYKGIRMHNQSRKQTSLIASDTEWVTGFHQKDLWTICRYCDAFLDGLLSTQAVQIDSVSSWRKEDKWTRKSERKKRERKKSEKTQKRASYIIE